MHLVFNHVAQLQHVSDTHGSHLVEWFASTTIVQLCLAITWQTSLRGPLVQVIQGSTVEDRSSELLAQLLACPTEHGFEDLTQVHT